MSESTPAPAASPAPAAAGSEPAERTRYLPPWAHGALLVLGLAGAAWLLVRDQVRLSSARQVLQTAQVDVAPTANGLDENFAYISLKSPRRPYVELLEYCHSRPALAQQVFREALASGTPDGRALACHMAFYLAQENKDLVTPADLQSIAGLLSPDQKHELRCVAQQTLSQLLLLQSPARAKEYAKVPAPPPATGAKWVASGKDADGVETYVKADTGPEKDKQVVKWAAATEEQKVSGGTYLRVHWSHPDVCLAWWARYREQPAWNADLKCFVIPAPRP